MTPSQEPEPSEELEPSPELESGGSRRWLAAGIVVGTGLVLGGAVALGGWVWSRNYLAPWLSEELTEILNRPVELGSVEQVGLSGVRLGPSTMPPTPTDPDTLSLEAVEVRFRLLDLWRRELPISLTLEQGDLYLEQNADKQWFDLDIDLPDRDPDRDPFFDVRVDTIYITDGQLTMVPYVEGDPEPAQVAIADLQGQLQFSNALVEVPDDPDSPLETQQLNLALSGNSSQEGSIDLKGAILLPPPQPVPSDSADATEVPGPGLRANINLRTQAAQATDIMPLVDSFFANPLPVQFPTGLVSGQVDIESGRGVPFQIVGTARVDEASLITRGLPEAFEELQGDMRFRGRSIEFEGATARLGRLPLAAGGTLDFDEGYDLSGQIAPFTVAQAVELFDATLPVATTGTFLADVTMTGPLNQPVIASDIVSQSAVVIDQVPFADLRGSVTLQAPNLTIDSFQAIPQDGGSLVGSGQFNLDQPRQLSLTMTGDRLPGTAIGRRYGLPEGIDVGPVFVDAEFAGPPGQLVGDARWRAPMGTYPGQGTIRLADNALRFTNTFVQVAGGTVAGQGMLANRQWDADLRAEGVQLNQLGAAVDGVFSGVAQLSGSLQTPGLANIQGQGNGAINLAGGTVLTRASLAGGQWNADLQGRDLPMTAFAPDLQGTAAGRFRLTGTTDNLTLAGVRGQGQLSLSDGLATAASRAPQLALVREPLTADLAWNGQSVLVQRASTAGIQASGLITPQLSGPGAPAITNLDLNLDVNGYSLAALPVPEILPLAGNAFFQGRLRGRPGALALSGDASLVGLSAGDLAFASPLSGPVNFVQGGDLAVDLTGGGDRVYVATSRGDRDLEFEVRGGAALAQGFTQGDDLYATVANLPVENLRLPQGGVNGIGTVSGLITAAEIVANLRQPTLRASFDVQDPSVGYLRLPSETEVVAIDPDAPERQMEVTRYSRLRGTVTFANNVVGLVGGVLESASGRSRYLASGTYTLGDTPQINGELTVDNGQINEILQTLLIFERADFRPNLLRPPEWFRPANPADLASLEQVSQVGDRNASLLDQLRRLAEVQELQDMLAAQAETAPLPPLDEFFGGISGTVTASGAIPDGLDVSFDLAGADWVWGNPNGNNGATYRIDEFIAQGSYQDSVLRVEPISLRSDFSGFSATTQQGVALATLNGEVSFNPDDPINRTLRLEVSDVPVQALRQPLRLPDNFDGLINLGASLTGSLVDPQVRGQLAISEATINRNAIDLATANFSYDSARLRLISRVAVDDQADDPLRLVASIPLPLPGFNQRPESDDVTIALRVRDEGFALINLFTQAIAWESGQANLDLAVAGRWPLDRPLQDALTTLRVTGSADFNGVTISARALSEPLTNLRGRIEVVEASGSSASDSLYTNGLVLDVQNLQGDFSNGQVLAGGNLKLLPSVQDLAPGLFDNGSAAFSAEADRPQPGDNPFELTLDNIVLDLRSPAGTYRGRVDGNVVVGGSVFLLPPLVYGEVRLSNGLITLPDGEAGGGAPADFAATREPSIFDPIPPALEDFQLVLADNVRLAIPGLVDVQAEGTLDLVGTAPDIRPNGRINLPNGRISLLTTDFRLTGDENFAEFSDLDETIDPYLVATLSAAVPDSAAAGNTLSTASPFPRNEISVSRIDQLGLTQAGVQIVRIRAVVDGRASRVVNLQGVELSSTPPRSEGEIVALISGGFLTALESTLGSVSGGGDSFQGLLAFAGTALLNNLQNILGSGLERTELRLFSASPPGQQGGALDIGGEVGFNFSPTISASVQKVFTNVTPAVFSVRYRITNQITVRATTSYEQFNENTGAVVEFRF